MAEGTELAAGVGKERFPVRAVARSIDLVMALTRGPMTLGALAKGTGLSKATAHRLLATLAYQDLVVQDPQAGEYSLGPGCFRLVEAVSDGLSGLGAVARPVLEQLREDTGETITLHVRIASQRICIEELTSRHEMRYTAGLGATAAVHVGSAGKLLLAYLDEPTRERLLHTISLTPVTAATVTDAGQLRGEFEQIRKLGWAESRGERIVGAASVSAPVFDANGSIVAALSVLGPEARLHARHFMAAKDLVVTAAAEISTMLRELSQPSFHVMDQ